MRKEFSKQRENQVYIQGQSHILISKPRYILCLTTSTYVRIKQREATKGEREIIIDTELRFVANLTLEFKCFPSDFLIIF